MKVGSDLEDDKRRSQIIREEIGYQHKLVKVSVCGFRLSRSVADRAHSGRKFSIFFPKRYRLYIRYLLTMKSLVQAR